MKRILVDVDCVVADLMPEWLGFYNAEYDDHVCVDDVKEWDLEAFVKPDCGNKIYDYLKLSYLYDQVQPIDGALSSVRWLRGHSYEIIFVTSGVHIGKMDWLIRYGFSTGGSSMYAHDVVVAHNKSLIKGDIMIDDNPQNLNTFDGRKILFAQPWNDGGYGPHIFRADNWPDVIQYIVRGLP